MICNNCGFSNKEGSKFCENCGTQLTQQPVQQPAYEQPVQQPAYTQPVQQPAYEQQVYTQPVQQPAYEQPKNQNLNKGGIFKFLNLIYLVLIKPTKSLKDDTEEFKDIKNTGIFLAVLFGGITVINVITAFIKGLFVKEYDWDKFEMVTKVSFKNLKNVAWLREIFGVFFGLVAITVIISFLYYMASLILKKKINFPRLSARIGLSLVPILITTFILSPLIGLIYSKGSVLSILLGLIYTLMLIVRSATLELELVEDDIKIFVHSAVLTLLFSSLYFIIMEAIVRSVSSGISNLFG